MTTAVAVIDSQPRTRTQLGRTYLYPTIAHDPDFDPLTYRLVTAPTGMTIDPTTGLIAWEPTAEQLGRHSVRLRVEDGRGGRHDQPYDLELRAGDVIFTRDGRQQRINRIEQRYDGPTPVCNLSVDGDHTFAVGADGILVHNTSWCQKLIDEGIEIPSSLAKVAQKPNAPGIHGHHIVMQKGRTDRQKKAVEKSVKILKKAGIKDHVNDLDNVTFALNWDHSGEYAESVLRRLQKAEADAKASKLFATDKEAAYYKHVKKALDDIKKCSTEERSTDTHEPEMTSR